MKILASWVTTEEVFRLVHRHRPPDPTVFKYLDRAYAACAKCDEDGWFVAEISAIGDIYATAVDDDRIYLLEDLGL